MKSYFYILFFLYSLQLSTSKEVQISNPIIADYYDCIYKDNQIIVYGTNGIINISNDDGKTWATQKIFDRGKIVFMSYENDGIYAVNENGEIIKSENNGRFFKPYSNFTVTPDKRIWSMKKFEDKFLIRTINSISLLDKNFSLIKKETLPTLNESMYAYTDSLLTQFVNNFVVFKDNIIVSLDSAQFMVFDKSLNIKEKRNLFFELDKSYNLVPIFISKDKIIFDTYYYTFKYDLTTNEIETLVKYYQQNPFYLKYFSDVIDDKFIFLPNQFYEQYKIHLVDINGELDTTIQILNNTFVQYNLKTINKVIKKDNKYILLGDRNTIIIVETEKDSNGKIVCKTNEISKCYGFNPELLAEPFRNEDKVIFTFQKKRGYEHYMFEINDTSQLIKAVIPEYKLEDGKFNTNVLRARNLVRLRNYNQKTKELKLFSTFDDFTYEAYYFSTKDFFRDKIESVQVNDNILGHNSNQTFIYSDLLNFNDKFVVGMYIENDFPNYTSKIYTYNYGFTTKETYTIQDEFGKNKKLEYLYSEDDQKYLLIYYDNDKSTLEIKSSYNTFNNFQSLYSFKNTNDFVKHKTVEFGGIPFVIYLLYDTETYKYSFEMFNLRDNSKFTLYEFTDELIDNKKINFDVYQEKIYLSVGNKLLNFKGTLSNPEWNEYSLPNNGEINNYMYIQNNFLYCRYEDEKNDLNLYRIELVDSLVNSVEVDIENEIKNSEYVYLYQPYPNPTNNEINTEVFWSNSFDIESAELGVYNLNGEKISNSTNLTLEKVNNNKGNIKWNSTGQPSGTYLIKIQHGNNTKSVKVVVN